MHMNTICSMECTADGFFFFAWKILADVFVFTTWIMRQLERVNMSVLFENTQMYAVSTVKTKHFRTNTTFHSYADLLHSDVALRRQISK